MTPDRRERRYSDQLDALRAIALLAVLYSHFWDSDSIYGHLGVRLFFVISGFLITGILLRSRSMIEAGAATTGLAIGHFLARRALRIFPAYYLLMLALAAVNAQNISSVLPWHLLYASNILCHP